jgi:A/G-specific adenine glycosylase
MEPDEGLKKAFRQQLLKWNKKDNLRQMPWKGEKDPYKIWISEVILQQTRVEQGMKYYENFIAVFPTVHALAKAPEEKVFKLWEGLGYYSRCKNLIDAARHVSENLDGFFPQDFDSIIQLKGIGSYTASAIASFAFNLPYAVVDGNVFRVLSRIMNIEIPIDSTEGKKHFSKLACSILPKKRAGEFNQAIMDFGASICKPYPECKICFFNNHCKAYLRGKQDSLPVKEKRTKIRERWFNYFVIKYKDEVLIHQRISNDIWQHLFEFVLIETTQILTQKKLASLFKKQYGIAELRLRIFFQVKQKLSHQLIQFNFLEVEFDQKEINLPGFFWVKISELDKYAFPKSLQEFVVKHLK